MADRSRVTPVRLGFSEPRCQEYGDRRNEGDDQLPRDVDEIVDVRDVAVSEESDGEEDVPEGRVRVENPPETGARPVPQAEDSGDGDDQERGKPGTERRGESTVVHVRTFDPTGDHCCSGSD